MVVGEGVAVRGIHGASCLKSKTSKYPDASLLPKRATKRNQITTKGVDVSLGEIDVC